MDAVAEKKPNPKKGTRERPPHTRCKVFARNVNYILHAKGKNRSSFALDIGLPQPYISNLLNGKHEPRIGTLFTIADGLGVPPELLIATELDVVKRFMEKAKKSDEEEAIPLAMTESRLLYSPPVEDKCS